MFESKYDTNRVFENYKNYSEKEKNQEDINKKNEVLGSFEKTKIIENRIKKLFVEMSQMFLEIRNKNPEILEEINKMSKLKGMPTSDMTRNLLGLLEKYSTGPDMVKKLKEYGYFMNTAIGDSNIMNILEGNLRAMLTIADTMYKVSETQISKRKDDNTLGINGGRMFNDSRYS